MEPVVLLLVAIALPTAAGVALIGAVRLGCQMTERERGPIPLGPPIEQIAADLRRLNHQRRQQVGQGPAPGRGVRTRARAARTRRGSEEGVTPSAPFPDASRFIPRRECSRRKAAIHLLHE